MWDCVGYPEVADLYLQRFGWGPTFITINKEILDIYAACTDARHHLPFYYNFNNQSLATVKPHNYNVNGIFCKF
jgi:hypothetical protein